MTLKVANPDRIESLRRQLEKTRRASLLAGRRGDFRKAAKLTAEAANLSKTLLQEEGLEFAAQF